MTNGEILKTIDALIKYCYENTAKRSEIIKRLKEIREECNSNLPFD